MADQQAGGAAPQIDVAAIVKTTTEQVLAALKPQLEPLAGQITELAKNQKIFGDTYAADLNKVAEAAKANAGKPGLTMEDVGKLVTEQVGKLFTSQQKDQQAVANRKAFIANEANGLAKLPDVYHGLLGADESKWGEESKSIAAKYQADFKASGGKIPNQGNPAAEGGTTANNGGSGNKGFLKMPEGMPAQQPATSAK